MSDRRHTARGGTAQFRRRLFITMTLVVLMVTVIAIFLVQRRMEADVRWNLGRRFEGEFNALIAVQNATSTALMDRCRALARHPRIHAAIEDGGLDLLYPIAGDELRRIMPASRPVVAGGTVPNIEGDSLFHILGFRFLDAGGAVIPPPPGHVDTDVAAGLHDLAMSALPEQEKAGYIASVSDGDASTVHSIIAVPIVSSENACPLAALLIIFTPLELPEKLLRNGVKSGVWTKGRLQLASCPQADSKRIQEQLTTARP